MIVESIVAGTTVIVVASLLFARAMDPGRARREAFAERRRLLERQRRAWSGNLMDGCSEATRSEAWSHMVMIDDELARLAKEEARSGYDVAQ